MPLYAYSNSAVGIRDSKPPRHMGIAELGARPSFAAKVLNLCDVLCDCPCYRLCGGIAPSMHNPEKCLLMSSQSAHVLSDRVPSVD
eukprot:1647349-Alexandrium_andersonii.AAC.1